jgi:DNA-binding transcriptional ArsR family regulator
MPAATKEKRGIDQTLVHVLRHPVRVQALTILTERTASPKEISDELLEPLGTVAHHVRELQKLGLIELVREEPRRGAVEHYFRGKRRPLLSTEEWDELSLKDREQFSILILQLTLTDAAKALNAGTLDARTDRHLSRIPLELDEQGWREITEIQNTALTAILKAQAEATARLGESAGSSDVIHASASLACIETPPSSPDHRPE